MSLAKPLLAELESEAVATRKVLERMPDKKFEWVPHEKSMSLGHLASHLAELPGWVALTIEQDELIPGPDMPRFRGTNAEELVEHFDEQIKAAKNSLQSASDETLMKHWRMKIGDRVLIDAPRAAVLRTWVLNHIVHHRAQLSLYLRLNDIAVPAIYGTSADEESW